MPSTIVVGGFFGDEGKGKIISHLALRGSFNVSVRCGVGPNAGHTIVWQGKTFKMRMITSAFVNPSVKLLIGPGVLVDPLLFLKEVKEVGAVERTGLDPLCAIIEPRHVHQDRSSNHLKGKIGTTGTGCGPCNVDRVRRIGKTARDIPELRRFLIDVPAVVNNALERSEGVLLEGSQGTFLSLFHGTYPYVTSKDVTASSIAADAGLGPKRIDDVIIVFKAFVTRVGGGPLENELSEEEAVKRGWHEVATVTGRSRRAAPFDFDLARRAIMLNSANKIAITKLDVLFPECKAVNEFTDLPSKAVKFIGGVEKQLGIPVTLIGTGPGAEEIIEREV